MIFSLNFSLGSSLSHVHLAKYVRALTNLSSCLITNSTKKIRTNFTGTLFVRKISTGKTYNTVLFNHKILYIKNRFKNRFFRKNSQNLKSSIMVCARVGEGLGHSAETRRELLEKNSSAQQCQYRLPLMYLPHVLAQRVSPSWPRLCERGIIIHIRAWHFMSKKPNITVSFCKQS